MKYRIEDQITRDVTVMIANLALKHISTIGHVVADCAEWLRKKLGMKRIKDHNSWKERLENKIRELI